MRWYVPFNQLSLRQRSVLDGIGKQIDKPHWIQGFAGTGKTVVLSHLIERIAADQPRASLCFITFTHALKDLVQTGFYGPVAQRLMITTHTQFLRDKETFDYVFLDEVQDIKPLDLAKIKSYSRHLYVAGDSDQRIYDEGSQEEDIAQAVGPISWKLLEIFRLTKLLKDVAMSILPTARVVEGSDAAKTANVTIRRVQFTEEAKEVQWVWTEALRRSRPGDPSVILFPTHDAIAEFSWKLADVLKAGPSPRVSFNKGRRDYGPFNYFWSEKKLPVVYLGNGFGSLVESDTKPLVYFMTFHSSKGLDFKNVFIPGLDSSVKFVSSKALINYPDLDRRLLFVAVTRSRENLFLSYSGHAAHPYLTSLPIAAVTEAQIKEARNTDQEEFF